MKTLGVGSSPGSSSSVSEAEAGEIVQCQLTAEQYTKKKNNRYTKTGYTVHETKQKLLNINKTGLNRAHMGYSTECIPLEVGTNDIYSYARQLEMLKIAFKSSFITFPCLFIHRQK